MSETLLWLAYAAVLLLPARRRLAWFMAGAGLAAALLAWHLDEPRTAVFVGAAVVAGLSAWFTNHATRREVARLQAEREALARQAAELLVREDQLRIARELHDGIGAHLAALVWRTQRLQREAGAAIAVDMRRLQALATSALDDLRTTIWTLHTPVRAWPEVLDYLRSRVGDREGGAAVVDASPPSAVERSVGAEVIQSLLRALRDLPAGARLTLRLEAESLIATLEAEGGTAPRSIVLPLTPSSAH